MITSPATIVGSANGRSMIALTTLLPANESRTRTHAMIVPNTAVVSTASVETTSVSFNAETACGEETTSQKPDQPLPVDFQMIGRDRQHDDDEQERRDEAHLQGESRRGSLPAVRGRAPGGPAPR